MGRWQRGDNDVDVDHADDFDDNDEEGYGDNHTMMMIQVIIGGFTSVRAAEQSFWDKADVSHGEHHLNIALLSQILILTTLLFQIHIQP